MPEPASEGELDQLRMSYAPRSTSIATTKKVFWPRCTKPVNVGESERDLAIAKQHSRAFLVTAYVNGEEIGCPSGADCAALLAIRREQPQRSTEIEDVIRAEIADLENGLRQHGNRVAEAAGAFTSRTPQLLALVGCIRQAFATLRDVRLTVAEMRRMVWLDDGLCKMTESNQPSGAGRWGGYDTNEQLVSDWIGAMGRLLTDGDALMPGDSYKIRHGDTNGGSNTIIDPSVVRGGHRGPSRQ